MAVTSTATLEAGGLYVPFTGSQGSGGPRGTYSGHFEVTGDASGNPATVIVQATRENGFGFRSIIVVQYVTVRDGAGTAQTVRFDWLSGLRRMVDQIALRITTTDLGSENVGVLSGPSVPIEVDAGGNVSVMQAVWPTNNNGVVMELEMAGVVYDIETIAKARGLYRVEGPLAGPMA